MDVMMRGRLLYLALTLVAGAAAQNTPAARLTQWKKVDMPVPAGLSVKERQMVDKLAHAVNCWTTSSAAERPCRARTLQVHYRRQH